MVGVRDVERAAAWYINKLALYVRARSDGRVYLTSSCRGELSIELFPAAKGPQGGNGAKRPVLFTAALDAVHKHFRTAGIPVEPIQTNGGGTRFFRFRDLDGNTIEMCAETR